MIAHDSVVKHISDRIGIMYLKIVESGKKDQIFAEPKHPLHGVLTHDLLMILIIGGAQRLMLPAVVFITHVVRLQTKSA